MSLAIRAISNAFPQELRLIKDIISGQYLFWRMKKNVMVHSPVAKEQLRYVSLSVASYRKLRDFAQSE